MNYTTKKTSVIFELELSSFFGKGNTYNCQTRERKEYWLNNKQDFEEDFFDNFDFYSEKFPIEDGDIDKANNYIKSKVNATKKELNLFSGDIIEGIERAKNDAFNSNYQSEWLKRYFIEVDKDIESELKELDINYKQLDDLETIDYDKEFISIEIKKSDIKAYLKTNNIEIDEDYIDIFHDYALDINFKPTSKEHIDYYGTLGSTDNWLDCFKDYEEITTEIKAHRKDEANKVNNAKRASQELADSLTVIDNYINDYITAEPAKTKITRQINALKSVIKNAI